MNPLPARPSRAWFRAWLGATCASAGLGVLAAEPDLPGSADPPDFARFPGAWIVAYSAPDAVRDYEFITGPVDKIRRDVRIDNSLRLSGTLTRVTWQAPNGTRLADAVAHYRGLALAAGGRLVFECSGPDCGRSTVWANHVFRVPVLAAPNRTQHFLAAAMSSGDGARLLATIYVVQRGNRRVYAHVDTFAPDPGAVVEFDRNRDLAQVLARHGHAVLEGVTPGRLGRLPPEALATLQAIASSLAAFADQPLHVVCHLGGSAPMDTLLARSTACAEEAAATLSESGISALAFGAGPLLPREDAPLERVELVAPERLRRR